MNFDVIVLLVKVLKDAPDFRAAAVISETISKLIPSIIGNYLFLGKGRTWNVIGKDYSTGLWIHHLHYDSIHNS